MRSFPLIVRGRHDKFIRRFCYADRALAFMLREIVFTKRGVLTLTHQLGMELAYAKETATGVSVYISDAKLYQCFKVA